MIRKFDISLYVFDFAICSSCIVSYSIAWQGLYNRPNSVHIPNNQCFSRVLLDNCLFFQQRGLAETVPDRATSLHGPCLATIILCVQMAQNHYQSDLGEKSSSPNEYK